MTAGRAAAWRKEPTIERENMVRVRIVVDKEVNGGVWKEKRGQEPNILADPTPTKLYRCTKLSPAHLL